MVTPYVRFVWDMERIAELVSVGISMGAVAVVIAGLTGFTINKIIKLGLGRL